MVVSSEYWQSTDSIISDWTVFNVDLDWSPDLSSEYENELITQKRTVDKERTVQEQEFRESTGEYRDVGDLITEQSLDIVETQYEYGLLEYWESTDPLVITDWVVTEVFQDWTPDASTVYETETVNQYREVKKERTIQQQEIRPKTGEIQVVSGTISDTTLTTEYQDVQGELEYWVNTGESACTEWVFDRYDEWTPNASDYNRDETVSQTRIVYNSRECSGEQERPLTGETRYATAEIEYETFEESQEVYGTLIDLNDWGTTDTNGSWSVSADGSYAYQAINGSPTVFESSADTYENVSITGKMRVEANAGDNDWIGMAVGITDSDNFYLWSWKNGPLSSTTEKEGHNFAKVQNKSAINWAMHTTVTDYTVLATKHGDYGWNHGNYYDFEIIYTSTNVKIYIDGSLVINVNGTFPAGKIGFFNYSQGSVEYYKVTDTAID